MYSEIFFKDHLASEGHQPYIYSSLMPHVKHHVISSSFPIVIPSTLSVKGEKGLLGPLLSRHFIDILCNWYFIDILCL